jgi:hypothetical protein
MRLILLSIFIPWVLTSAQAQGEPTINGVPESAIPEIGSGVHEKLLSSLELHQVKLARQQALARLLAAFNVTGKIQFYETYSTLSQSPILIHGTDMPVCIEPDFPSGFVTASGIKNRFFTFVWRRDPEINLCYAFMYDLNQLVHILIHEAFHLSLNSSNECYVEAYAVHAAKSAGQLYSDLDRLLNPYWTRCQLEPAAPEHIIDKTERKKNSEPAESSAP